MDAAARDLATLALDAPWGTVRNHAFIARPADDVWAVIADVGRIHEWFPAFSASSMEGNLRTVVLDSGLPIVEEIVLVDHEQRRLQYRVVPNALIADHRATVDVIADGPDRCVLVYSTDLAPNPLVLTFGSGIGDAVANLQHLLESGAPASSRTRPQGASEPGRLGPRSAAGPPDPASGAPASSRTRPQGASEPGRLGPRSAAGPPDPASGAPASSRTRPQGASEPGRLGPRSAAGPPDPASGAPASSRTRPQGAS